MVRKKLERASVGFGDRGSVSSSANSASCRVGDSSKSHQL